MKASDIYIIIISITIIIYIYVKKQTPLRISDRTIWQTYKTKTLPAPAAAAMSTWIQKNPTWTHSLYDDADIDEYIVHYWDQAMYRFYKSLPVGVMKADLWRYLILTTHGGVYSDIDSECVVPIDDWKVHVPIVSDNILVIGLEDDVHFCQWTIYSTKEHPVMRHVCEYILRNYEENGIDRSNPHFVHATTGPGVWTAAIKDYLGMPQGNASGIYRAYKHQPEIFNKQGIYIYNRKYFSGKYSKNLYGSQFFGDGYIRWTEAAQK